MKRWEARLARLEETVGWLVRLREEKRTEPQRIAKWMAWLARNDPAPAPRAVAPAARRPERSEGPKGSTKGPVGTSGPSPDGSGRQELLGASGE